MEKCGQDYRGGGMFYETYPYQKIIQVPGDGTAFANRGKHANCTVCLRWAGENNDAWIKDWIKDFVAGARAVDRQAMLKEQRDPTVENSYVNFHLPEHPVEKAFRDNLPRLIELKKKWDPMGRFNKWFNIPTI